MFSGHIEMSGQPVDSFTQQDIDTGVISYVHGSNSDKQLNKTSLKLTLQVIMQIQYVIKKEVALYYIFYWSHV